MDESLFHQNSKDENIDRAEKNAEVGGKHIVVLKFSGCLNNLVGRLNCGWLLFSSLDKSV